MMLSPTLATTVALSIHQLRCLAMDHKHKAEDFTHVEVFNKDELTQRESIVFVDSISANGQHITR